MTPDVLIDRHSFVVRLTHWIRVVCLAVLLMSGLGIITAFWKLRSLWWSGNQWD